MKEDENKRNLDTFKKSIDGMIQVNSSPNLLSGRVRSTNYFLTDSNGVLTYTNDEVDEIIEGGDPTTMSELSRHYFYASGFYRRIIFYYAYLLTYAYAVIPNIKDKKYSKINKSYNTALDLCDGIGVKGMCEHVAVHVLVDGAYYGAVIEKNGKPSLLDLPFSYCRVRFKGYSGLDIVEMDLRYFTTITDTELRNQAFKAYPKGVAKAYEKYKNGTGDQWFLFPEGIGIHCKLYENRPFFLNSIKAVNNFVAYRDLEIEKETLETKKILVQQLQVDKEGELVFEPEEALELHRGAVEMLKNNTSLDVLTTFAEVHLESLAETRQTVNTNLEAFQNMIYSESGASSNIFAATGNLSLDQSLKNDLSLMMNLADQFSNLFTFVVNEKLANKSVDYSVVVLPISHYNTKEYIENTFKLAASGYSFILPALASGLTQKEFFNIKVLENDILKLNEILIPLSSSYTQSGDGGRPPLEPTKKTDKTITNQEGAE